MVFANIMGNRSAAALVFDDKIAANRNLETARFESSVDLVCLYDKNNNLFTEYKANKLIHGCKKTTQNKKTQKLNNHLVIRSRIHQEGNFLGTIIIHANKDSIQQSTVSFLIFFAFVVLLVIGAITIITRKRLRTLMYPLEELHDTAREIANNTLSEKRARQISNDEVGELVGVFNQMLDNITKEHKAVFESECQLRQTEQELRHLFLEHESILSTIPDVAYKLDTSGSLVWWNKRFEQVTELKPEQLHGIHGSEFFPENERSDISEGIAEAITSGFAEREAHFLTKQGPVLYHFNGAAVKDDEGNIIGVTGIGRDVNAQRAAEQSLRESEQRFAISQKYSNVGTFEWNLQTNQVFWSEQMWHLAGIAPNSIEITFNDYIDTVHPEDREYLKESLQYSLENGNNMELEYRIVWPDDSIHWVRGRGHIELDANNQPMRVLGVLIDIDSIKAAQQEQEHLQLQLQQAQKMEAIGHLTGGIAHDFNNMLASILGFTTLAMQLKVKDESKKLSGYLRQIERAGERARDLIAQMLTFSRSTDINPQLQSLNLGPLLKEAIKMLRPILPSSISIKEVIRKDIPPVMANPVKLHQVIMNLCVNSRDAMDGQGTIGIGLREVKKLECVCSSCHSDVSGTFVELSITDSGSGIDEEVLTRLFEPFYTTKGVGKGTGMGLAMVHGIIHEHGGHIVVENTKQGGAVFRLLFPRQDNVQPQVMHTSENRQQTVQGQGKRILVVDDETAIADFLKELLLTKGFQVHALSDSQEALTYFNSHSGNIDLVVTDQTMPGMTGIQMANSMLKQRPDLPIILATGFSEVANQQTTEALGIKGFIKKPVDVNDLLNAVNKLL